MKKTKRLPTILGIFILLAGATAGVFLIRQGTNQFLRASQETTPRQVKITNVTDNAFTVSWITDTAINGFIKYDISKELTLVAQDDRNEISGETNSFSTHHVTIKGLKPKTTYFFKIFSDKKALDSDDQEYQATTASIIQDPLPENDVAYGTIVQADGSPAEGVVVYLSLANAVPQSTLTKASGSWLIPLSSILANNLTSYVSYDREASIEEIFVQGIGAITATAIAITKNDSPMPTITLGQAFDFRTTQAKPTQPPTVSQPEAEKGRFSVETGLKIINPSEGENINALKPEFSGTGPAGEKLTITVHSPQIISDDIIIAENGSWNWVPPSSLSVGEHTITITLPDGQSISRLFTVLAAGESDLPSFASTPSATLTPSVTPSITATPSPTPTATISGRISMPSTESGVPDSGILTPTFLFSIMGIILIGIGLIF